MTKRSVTTKRRSASCSGGERGRLSESDVTAIARSAREGVPVAADQREVVVRELLRHLDAILEGRSRLIRDRLEAAGSSSSLSATDRP